MAIAFLSPAPEDKPLVLHRDGDGSNNALTNLYWGDQFDNMQDAVRHGRHANANKVRCPQEHDLVAPNLVASALPTRKCLACARARARRQKRPDLDMQTLSDAKYREIMDTCR